VDTVTYSTQPWHTPTHRYTTGGIARQNDAMALCVGGTNDHAHLLLQSKPTIAVSRMLQLLKGGSSLWKHETAPHLNRFAWQDGFGAFTIGTEDIPIVLEYIRNQKEHHRMKTFQEEYLEFLKQHDIKYDE
jgi:putative transposase